MRITVETSLAPDVGESFLALYRESFAPLERLAAGRQSLTDEEFLEEMDASSVLKFVGWDGQDKPCAMALVATDLSVVPWISPPYFADQFPEQYARNAIYYFGALLVDPRKRQGPWAAALLKALVRMVAENKGIAAFDCCRFNVEVVGVPQMVAAIGEQLCHFEPVEIDVQRYYAYVSSGLREDEIDLRDRQPEVVDLTAAEAETRQGATEQAR